jgi:uncharacterized Zn-binding protein involved in type VI secretion
MSMPAARVGDPHICPMVTALVPHVGGPILPPCCFTVLTGGMPQARISDLCVCVGPPDAIAKGSVTVLVGGLPAARLGDMTAHGGMIVMGMPTVLIGGRSRCVQDSDRLSDRWRGLPGYAFSGAALQGGPDRGVNER